MNQERAQTQMVSLSTATLKNELERLREPLSRILPKHLSPDRLVKVVLSCAVRSPKVLECTLPSILEAVMQAGELGLELGGMLGEAYLVPFRGRATCIIGYRGYIKLAFQSGFVQSVNAHVVYRQDHFHADLGAETISHVPKWDGPRAPGDVTNAYMIAHMLNGGRVIDVMPRQDLEAIRARSKAKAEDTPWQTDYAEMCRKTVTRRGLKLVPSSAQLLHTAIERDEAIEVDQETGEVLSG